MIVLKAYRLLLKKGNMKTMSELKIEPNEATVCDMQEIKHGKWIFEKRYLRMYLVYLHKLP